MMTKLKNHPIEYCVFFSRVAEPHHFYVAPALTWGKNFGVPPITVSCIKRTKKFSPKICLAEIFVNLAGEK
jgi:hypothetical protein